MVMWTSVNRESATLQGCVCVCVCVSVCESETEAGDHDERRDRQAVMCVWRQWESSLYTHTHTELASTHSQLAVNTVSTHIIW